MKNPHISVENDLDGGGEQNDRKLDAEPIPEKERDISRFLEYVKKHEGDIKKRMKEGEPLWKIFYRDFYNKDIDSLKYQNIPEEAEEAFEGKISKLYERLLEESDGDYEKLTVFNNVYWLNCTINGGVRKFNSIGRIYINLVPENADVVFQNAVSAFIKEGLHVSMKIINQGNPQSFNRFDKMVIYFGEEEERDVLDILDLVYKSNRDAFDDTGIPRFTIQLADKDGNLMSGVGFGEDPIDKHESFGGLRCRVLVGVFYEAMRLGVFVYDPDFDFEEYFEQECLRRDIDPQNPAFNISEGIERFKEVRKRHAIANHK